MNRDHTAFGSEPIYLTGPTASGKTAVGVALAGRIGAEVIALDSMTLYRGMDIGTAKPTEAERGGVAHHLIDVLDPSEAASVGAYRDWAGAAAAAIVGRGRRVLFVGGTPLYLKAMLRGLFDGPTADPELRRALDDRIARDGPGAVHRDLAEVDPVAAGRIHPHDARRIVRALEVLALTGRPISERWREHETPAEGAAVFALARPREELRRRIDGRVDAMFAAGLVEEVRRLVDASPPIGPVAAQGVGYRETIAMLRGETSMAETIARVSARTRQFAKRQETWFRGLAEVEAWPVGPDEPPEATADRLAARVVGGP